MAEFAEYPFSKYKVYKIYHQKEKRYMANLVNPITKERHTISYARYLISVKYKRILVWE